MNSRWVVSIIGATIVAALLASRPASTGDSSELKIFGSRVTKMIMADIGPPFEQATGYQPVVITDVAAVMKRRIEQGEPFDLAILVNFQTDDLIKAGKLAADTRADIMKAGIGLGFITYALAKILAGKFAEAKPAVVILAILFAVKFAVAG